MENGIEEEKATEIESAVKTDLHKDFIPKEQYNKKVQHITELEEKLQEAGKDSVDVQDYKQQIKALEDKYNNYKAEIEAGAEKRNKQEIIKSELHKQGLHSSIIELLDYDVNNFEFNEGAVAGDSWDAYSSGLKEKYKDFYKQEDIKGQDIQDPPATGQKGKGAPVSIADALREKYKD